MPTPVAPARVTARHVQLARALFAAVAALMITFSPDHSAEVGLAAFGGFGIATGLVFALAAWLVARPGERGSWVLLSAPYIVIGMIGSLPLLRTDTSFFVLVIVFALLAGLIELLQGLRLRERLGRGLSRDAVFVGALTIVLGLALLLVPVGYSLEYVIEEAGRFTLTGITIGVGIFGGYAAIVAVYLAIAGFSPEQKDVAAGDAEDGALAAAQEDRS